jgi:hypothetical protein
LLLLEIYETNRMAADRLERINTATENWQALNSFVNT